MKLEPTSILAELESERDRLDHVIESLRHYIAGGAAKRGRKPAGMNNATSETASDTPRRGRPPGSKNKKDSTIMSPAAKDKDGLA